MSKTDLSLPGLQNTAIAALGVFSLAAAAQAQAQTQIQTIMLPAPPPPRPLTLSHCPGPDMAECFAKKAPGKAVKTFVPPVSNPDRVIRPKIELKHRF